MENQLYHNHVHAAPHHHPPMLLPKLDAMTLHAPTTGDYYCLYKTNKCRNLRGVKRDGTLHRLCNDHREKANESQRKSETKKRSKQSQPSGGGAPPSNYHFHDPSPQYQSYTANSTLGQPHLLSPTRRWQHVDSSSDGSHNNSPHNHDHRDDNHPRADGSSRMTLDFILAHDGNEYDSDSCYSLEEHSSD
ncbi:hypothetical protein H310_00767 [Aphanomyces invadans]|uniref:Uncharacterized protein n=1 Tax=Aphanomyces invadans TaxID=157072 RepID=A0A024UWY2_9STRA|nr:hypothetical protein H310_00767 [Aphanomyces invadans]ETW10470.1 hypothetical protein H310_00767 [Aphanomyces invadans]|eukprot:XP_008861881.1 hypothetical protein H310_00767 [Aphanomyces invadans]